MDLPGYSGRGLDGRVGGGVELPRSPVANTLARSHYRADDRHARLRGIHRPGGSLAHFGTQQPTGRACSAG